MEPSDEESNGLGGSVDKRDLSGELVYDCAGGSRLPIEQLEGNRMRKFLERSVEGDSGFVINEVLRGAAIDEGIDVAEPQEWKLDL